MLPPTSDVSTSHKCIMSYTKYYAYPLSLILLTNIFYNVSIPSILMFDVYCQEPLMLMDVLVFVLKSEAEECQYVYKLLNTAIK